MATHSITSCIFIFFLISNITFSNACGSCGTPPKPPTPPCAPIPPKGPPAYPFCPLDTLKLGVCADVLGLVNVVIGSQTSSKCCALLEGLVDLEAAVCLCTAIKANVLGINLNVPISLSLLLSACEKSLPPGFKCE